MTRMQRTTLIIVKDESLEAQFQAYSQSQHRRIAEAQSLTMQGQTAECQRAAIAAAATAAASSVRGATLS